MLAAQGILIEIGHGDRFEVQRRAWLVNVTAGHDVLRTTRGDIEVTHPHVGQPKRLGQVQLLDAAHACSSSQVDATLEETPMEGQSQARWQVLSVLSDGPRTVA